MTGIDWTAMTAEQAEGLAFALYQGERKAAKEAEAKCSTTTTQKE